MNVGSILNGDLPTENIKLEPKNEQNPRAPHPIVQRHSINNLLNDSPLTTQKSRTPILGSDNHSFQDDNHSFQDDHDGADDADDDVDSAAEMIDRELEMEFQKEEQLQEKQRLEEERKLKEGKLMQEKKLKDEKIQKNEKKEIFSEKNQNQLKLNLENLGNKLQKQIKSNLRDASRHKTKPNESHEPNPSGNTTKQTNTKKPQNSGLVLNEINRLNELKKTKWKPHRYSEPPIWAQQYISPSHRDKLPHNYLKQAPTNLNNTGGAGKAVFDRGSMHSSDLECLITGVIPPQSTVRTIAEWIYANFIEILVENRQYTELELKFGTIVDKVSGSRLAIGVSTECIYTDNSAIRFELSVHEAGWREMKSFMDELEKQYQEESRRDPTKPRKKFAMTETDNIDFFYTHSERNERPKKIRITKDQLLNPPRYAGVEKKRLSDIHIFNPSSMFDFRISLSLELPIAEGDIEPIMKKTKIGLQRGKKRTSYNHSATVTRFDFTEVSVPKPTRNKAGKTVVSNEVGHELELELDSFLIFRGFDKVRDGLDSIRFEELVEVFLNNARCCNNHVTKFASK